MDNVIKVRTTDAEILDNRIPDPHMTKKPFMTFNKPGMTAPEELPADFATKSIFPALRPVRRADLSVLTKEYYLFYHGALLTWGGLPVDPLVEFYMKDGESNKCVSFVPLKERLLYSVARVPEELPVERGIFAVPRDRMRDLLFWMDGVMAADRGRLLWIATRQHLPLNDKKLVVEGRQDDEYLSLFGFRTPKFSMAWAAVPGGWSLTRVAANAGKTTRELSVAQ